MSLMPLRAYSQAVTPGQLRQSLQQGSGPANLPANVPFGSQGSPITTITMPNTGQAIALPANPLQQPKYKSGHQTLAHAPSPGAFSQAASLAPNGAQPVPLVMRGFAQAMVPLVDLGAGGRPTRHEWLA